MTISCDSENKTYRRANLAGFQCCSQQSTNCLARAIQLGRIVITANPTFDTGAISGAIVVKILGKA